MSITWAIRAHSLADVQTQGLKGFNTLQLPVEAVAELSDAELDSLNSSFSARDTTLAVFEAPLPRGVQVTERGFNTYHWTEYLGNALRKIAFLGCKTLVWGDGRSRLLPVEGDVSTAKENFYQFMFILCGIAERYGIEVCLEPLGPRRTNFINSLDELKSSLSLIARNNLSMVLSPRDLVEMGLQASDMLQEDYKIRHVHLENPGFPETALAPDPADGHDYTAFLAVLHRRNYSGIIALPPGSSESSLRYCKDLWSKAAPQR